jgi:hypothetical protein
MLQEAWIAIAEAEAARTNEFYLTIGYRAIEALYKREYRYRKRIESLPQRRIYDATYRHKKYFLKVARKAADCVN